MAHILIVYGTTDGHTRKIAEYIAERVRQGGDEVEITDSTADPAPRPGAGFDACIIGGSVHEEKHQRSLAHYVQKNLAELQRIPTAFFSVSMAAAIRDEEHLAKAQSYIDSFLEKTGWQPDVTVPLAGALLYTQYDFFKRMLIKFIARHQGNDSDTSHDHIYTDWGQVDRFVDEFLVSRLKPMSTDRERAVPTATSLT
jgi:menaquinone-dependent protoporphyrinogen oxidase